MSNHKTLALTLIGAMLCSAVILSIIFLILAGLSYLVCIGFNIYWTWLTPVGLLAMIMLVGFVCKVIGIK